MSALWVSFAVPTGFRQPPALCRCIRRNQSLTEDRVLAFAGSRTALQQVAPSYYLPRAFGPCGRSLGAKGRKPQGTEQESRPGLEFVQMLWFWSCPLPPGPAASVPVTRLARLTSVFKTLSGPQDPQELELTFNPIPVEAASAPCCPH